MKSEIKLKVSLTAVNNDQCARRYRSSQAIIGPKHLCAGGVRGFDSCSGDSGAPMMRVDETEPSDKFWYLAGIVSFGPNECGAAGSPGVYTRVTMYTDWIISKLR